MIKTGAPSSIPFKFWGVGMGMFQLLGVSCRYKEGVLVFGRLFGAATLGDTLTVPAHAALHLKVSYSLPLSDAFTFLTMQPLRLLCALWAAAHGYRFAESDARGASVEPRLKFRASAYSCTYESLWFSYPRVFS